MTKQALRAQSRTNGERLIGDELEQPSSEIAGPQQMSMLFDAAITKHLRLLVGLTNDRQVIAQVVSTLCAARKAYFESKGGA